MIIKEAILIPKQDSLVSEDRKLQSWFQNLGIFLNTHPSDNEFRGKLSEDNPDSLWNARPLILKRVDYLKKRPNMVKVIRAAALFHDNGKRNDPANYNHPYDSAQEVEQYLKWMDF